MLHLQHKPSRIVDIDFSKPKRARSCGTPSTASIIVPQLQPSDEEKESFFTKLKSLAPKAAVL